MFAIFAVLDMFNDQRCQLQTFIIYTLIVGTLVVVGIIGNSLAFAVFWKGNFKSSTSFLFMCLAITDSAVLLTAFVVFSIEPLFSYTGYMNYLWHSYIVVFMIVAFIHCCAHTATMWMTVLIAVNRYIIVCRPLRASQWCTNSKVKKQMAAVLVSPVLYNIAVIFVFLFFGPQSIYTSGLHATFLLVLPICILAVLNIRLIKALNAHRRLQIQNRSIPKDTSTTCVLVIVIIVVIICQLPQLSNVVPLAGASGLRLTRNYTCDSYNFYICLISGTLVVLNSAVNFIIYILCNKRFRAVLMEKVFKRNAQQQEAIAPEMPALERENREPVIETRL